MLSDSFRYKSLTRSVKTSPQRLAFLQNDVSCSRSDSQVDPPFGVTGGRGIFSPVLLGCVSVCLIMFSEWIDINVSHFTITL